VTEEIQTKILGFLVTECGRKENAQCVSIRLFFAPPQGYAEEEIGSWQRKDHPERFDEFVQQEQWATEILQIATDHVNAQSKGRYRYVLRTLQHSGSRMSHHFALEPAYVAMQALDVVGGGDRVDGHAVVIRGFEQAMRINAQIFEGSYRTLAQQNKMLADENTQLREQNFKLIHEVEEARSSRLEREFHLRNLARKETLKEQGSQKFFQVLDLVMHEIAARRGGGKPADGNQLAQLIVKFGDSLTMEQGQAMMSLLNKDQVELFYSIMRAAAGPPPDEPAQGQQQQNHAPNGAPNGVS